LLERFSFGGYGRNLLKRIALGGQIGLAERGIQIRVGLIEVNQTKYAILLVDTLGRVARHRLSSPRLRARAARVRQIVCAAYLIEIVHVRVVMITAEQTGVEGGEQAAAFVVHDRRATLQLEFPQVVVHELGMIIQPGGHGLRVQLWTTVHFIR